MAPNAVVLSRPQKFLLLIYGGIVITVLVGRLFLDKEVAENIQEMKLYAQQAFFQISNVVAGRVASVLNGLLHYVTFYFQAVGIQVDLPDNTVTSEGVIFVAKCVLLHLMCYGMFVAASLLVTFLLKRLWWQLKVGVALACFGLTLFDCSVSKETRAIRLVCLVFVCILLSIRFWKDRTMAARIVHLEEQVKTLQNQVREMEKQARQTDIWKIRCAVLCCCLVLMICYFCYVVYLALRLLLFCHSWEGEVVDSPNEFE